MSPWSISITESFLNSSLTLPNEIRNRFPHVIEILKNDPTPNNGHSVTIRNHHLWRIYVTRRYRLFYKYDDQWVKLLKIVERDKDTYKSENLMTIAEEESLCVIKIYEDENLPVQSSFLTKEQLERWQIPQEYHKQLLNIQNEDDLLEQPIEEKWIVRIIDCLPARTKPIEEQLDEIDKKAEYVVKNSEDLSNYFRGEEQEFLLKLSEEQENILKFESEHPILVQGGPGTGKSILAYYRVKKLVKEGCKKILFTTLNQSLIEYSLKPLKALIGNDLEAKGITVKTVDEIAVTVYRKNYGEAYLLASEEISLLCLNSAIHTANLKIDVKKDILKLGLDYLLEEILIVIEARGIENSLHYTQCPRFGRGYKPNTRILEAIWIIYERWKAILSQSGYITIEQIRRKALEIVRQNEIYSYDAVVIDEAQDLSPVALKFLNYLVTSRKKIYLTADVEQSLKQRSFGWNYIQASINFQGQTKTLKRSFRNTEQIGKACRGIISSQQVTHFSRLTGNRPKIILTDNLLKQVERIKSFFEESAKEFKLPIYTGVILSPDPDYGEFIARQLTIQGLYSKYKHEQNCNLDKNCIEVLSLHSVKGLEFPFVVVVGLTEGILPKLMDDIVEDEKQELLKQQKQLFYVACSRAMRSLLVFGSENQPSSFLDQLRLNLYWYVEVLND